VIDRTKIAGSCQDAGHEPYKTFDLIDRGLDVYTIVLGCVFFFLDNAFEGWLHFTLDFAIRQLGDFILTKIAFFEKHRHINTRLSICCSAPSLCHFATGTICTTAVDQYIVSSSENAMKTLRTARGYLSDKP